MHRKAYAKITLYLHACKRVNKRMHFRNIIVPIDLFDMVYLDIHETMYIETDKSYLPNDKRNTVYRAIMLMKQKYEIKDNFKVRIVKNIPAQSGLGGGSADAACVIRMLNDMYQLNLSDLELIQVAKLIDEDTPYCLFNRPMIVEGIGDTLTPIDFDMKLYYLIVKPGFGVSTKSFLRRYKDFTQCAGYDACLSAIKKNDVEALMLATHNDFQATVMKRNVRMKRVSKELRKLNLNGVCMTGSGTGIYGLTTDFDTVVAAHAQLALQYPFVKYGRINVINE